MSRRHRDPLVFYVSTGPLHLEALVFFLPETLFLAHRLGHSNWNAVTVGDTVAGSCRNPVAAGICPAAAVLENSGQPVVVGRFEILDGDIQLKQVLRYEHKSVTEGVIMKDKKTNRLTDQQMDKLGHRELHFQ